MIEQLKPVQGDWAVPDKHGWLVLEPLHWHGVEPLSSGCRISAAFFTPTGLHRVPRESRSELQHQGFPCHQIEAQHSETTQLLCRRVKELGPSR